MNATCETDYDFQSKYTQAGYVQRRLIDRFFANVSTLVAKAAPRTALEVGCGEGFSTQRLATMVAPQGRLQACDVEARLVKAAQARNPSVTIEQASIYELPYADATQDLVIALEVLEHLEDPTRALAELVRVTRGALLVSVPREPLWRALNFMRGKYVADLGNTPGHLQHWSSTGFRRFIEGAARVQAVRKPLPWTIILAVKR